MVVDVVWTLPHLRYHFCVSLPRPLASVPLCLSHLTAVLCQVTSALFLILPRCLRLCRPRRSMLGVLDYTRNVSRCFFASVSAVSDVFRVAALSRYIRRHCVRCRFLPVVISSVDHVSCFCDRLSVTLNTIVCRLPVRCYLDL